VPKYGGLFEIESGDEGLRSPDSSLLTQPVRVDDDEEEEDGGDDEEQEYSEVGDGYEMQVPSEFVYRPQESNPVNLDTISLYYRPRDEEQRATDFFYIRYRGPDVHGAWSAPIRIILTGRDGAPADAYDWDEDIIEKVVFVVVMTLLALACCGICAFAYCYARKKKRKALEARNAVALQESSGGTQALAGTSATAPLLPPNAVDATSDTKSKFNKKFIIERSQLEKGAKVGEGSYGWVYKGTWRDMKVVTQLFKNEFIDIYLTTFFFCLNRL
jgi:hypothetical protein